MKNLTVYQRTSRDLESLKEAISDNLGKSRILYAVNPDNDDFYLLIQNRLHKVPSGQGDIISYDVDVDLSFVGLEYSTVTQSLYGACESGEILQISIDYQFDCEVVTRLNDSLQCMKLSPDHEMLILITASGTVVTMVSTFQVISEADLYSSEFGEKQFITVGWGKKETQFHGSEGKSAAKAKPEQIATHETDDALPRITWREDGSLFAIGFLNKEKKARQFKVFNREGTLQYTSELLNGLEECLSWKPSGSLIATTQSLANKHIVALFEKNGLKHREFSLPFEPNEATIRDLFWSPDSKILSIWCTRNKDSTSVLQLWMESNYHWYLKQTIEFPLDNPLLYATWSIASRYNKLILLTDQEILTCSYNWSIDHSKGKSINDHGVIGVIDRNKLLVTGFRDGIVPPPMAHQSLEISESINAIAFAPDIQNETSLLNSNAFFCVSSRNKLTFYKQLTNALLLEYETLGSCEIEWAVPRMGSTWCPFYDLQHFLWLGKNLILCSAATNENHSFLCILLVDWTSDERPSRVSVQEMYIMDGLIEHVIPAPDPDEAYVVVENSVVKFTKEKVVEPTGIVVPEYCYKIEVAKVGSKNKVLSLSYRNTFSVDGQPVAYNITSFYVHSEFLLVTTLQHTLISAPLNEKGFEEFTGQDLTVKPWENNMKKNSFADLNIRRIERGSYVIAALSKDSKTVLQMPRGNLECIQPRALSLYIIGSHLNNCEYLAAFDLMRKQRINLNITYDHDPEKFLENAEKFVEEIAHPNWLSLFLSELKEEDVTETTYANYYWKGRERTVRPLDKIDAICKVLREIMERKDKGNNMLQPILISLAKNKGRHGLELALSKIKEIMNMEEFKKTGRCPAAEEALRYLLYMVDVNILFDTALGMYDFDLTMFIASKSQKDPKEYVPFLNDLRNREKNHMKYSIDLYLKRYESALKHIAKDSSRFDECISLIKSHNLYTDALGLYERASAEFREVAKAYGQFLFSKTKYQEAGIMYQKSGDFEQAVNAFKLAGSWQDVVIVSTLMNLSLEEKAILYKELVKRLKHDKRYYDAASISLKYLNDVDDAILSFCDGRFWKEAIRTAYDSQRVDLIEKYIKANAYEHASYLKSQLKTHREDFKKYKSRLAVVRENLSKSQTEFQDGRQLIYSEFPDGLSDTSSVTDSTHSQKSRSSTTSSRSYRSSKNRRKQERKLVSLKEGGIFEDLGLLQALHQIVANVYRERDELNSLLQTLVYFDGTEVAEDLQDYMDRLIKEIDDSMAEVWNSSAPSSLAKLEAIENPTPSQVQELATSKRIVGIYAASPPLPSATPWKLDIF